MKIRVFQKGFNYAQDGMGNRYVWHLQGCNMHCPWCSNPEGMPVQGELVVDTKWLRQEQCPNGAIQEQRLNRRICDGCKGRECLENKRQKGLRCSYQEYEVSEIVNECISARAMFFDGGGVTLTGGEIGLQFQAVKLLLQQLKENQIHCAIESNGTHPNMMELVPYVDQWMMDVKHYRSDTHRMWTGIGNQQILRNLEQVVQIHPNVGVRVPLIPGFNDGEKDAEEFAKLFSRILNGTKATVEFLVYHEFGKEKWQQCGKPYLMGNVKLSSECREMFETCARSYGVTCVRT
jgi:pyruvate formate lyase activating enzyme